MWSVRWSDRLDAFVMPDRIDVARQDRRRGTEAAAVMRIARGAPDESVAQSLGREPSSVDSPRALPGAKAAAHVVLSNRFVRYALLHAGGRLHRRGEREIAARFALQQAFAGMTDGWRVTLGDTGHDATIAAGVDAQVVDDVVSGFAAHGWRVASVEPLLARCINASAAIDGSSAPYWLVCHEPTRLVLVRVAPDGIGVLRSHRLRAGETPDVRRLVDQARLSDGIASDERRVVLFSTEAADERALATGDGWVFEHVPLEIGLRPLAAT